jgi:hypothetical protein
MVFSTGPRAGRVQFDRAGQKWLSGEEARDYDGAAEVVQ